MSKAKGVWAALLTPQTDDGSIDKAALTLHATGLLLGGANGVALFGTTGEASSFTVEEREEVLEYLIKHGISPKKIIVGTGCCAIPDTVRLSAHATAVGCAGVLVLPPFYFKGVSDNGIYNSFAQIIDGVSSLDLKLYLYHFPDMAGVPISHTVIERLLAAYPRQVVGIKDSSGDLANMTAMAERFPDLDVFSGDDHLLWPLLKAGGVGSITATANIAPSHLATIYKEWQQDSVEARKAQVMLEAIWEKQLLLYPVTEALKEYLACETGNANWLNMRPPLVRLDKTVRDQFLSGMDATGFKLDLK